MWEQGVSGVDQILPFNPRWGLYFFVGERVLRLFEHILEGSLQLWESNSHQNSGQ